VAESGEPERVVRLRIRGRVQGVGFRYWMEREAERLGLDGWVRNRRDGSVEALIAGPAPLVADMIEACRQGPPAARVERVEAEPCGPPPPPGFRILPSV